MELNQYFLQSKDTHQAKSYARFWCMRSEKAAHRLLKIVFYDKSNSNKGGTNMSKDNIISLENPDVLTDLLKSGARELVAMAV